MAWASNIVRPCGIRGFLTGASQLEASLEAAGRRLSASPSALIVVEVERDKYLALVGAGLRKLQYLGGILAEVQAFPGDHLSILPCSHGMFYYDVN